MSQMTNYKKFYINKCIIINMNSNNEIKEIDIKNRTCYYFDDIIRIKDFMLNLCVLSSDIDRFFSQNL